MGGNIKGRIVVRENVKAWNRENIANGTTATASGSVALNTRSSCTYETLALNSTRAMQGADIERSDQK